MDGVIEAQRSGNPLFSRLLATFAILALILSAIGIYGLIAYSVGQRTHEIGIRLALGAKPSDISRMILRQGFKVAAVGLAIGFTMALPLPKVFDSIFQGGALLLRCARNLSDRPRRHGHGCLLRNVGPRTARHAGGRYYSTPQRITWPGRLFCQRVLARFTPRSHGLWHGIGVCAADSISGPGFVARNYRAAAWSNLKPQGARLMPLLEAICHRDQHGLVTLSVLIRTSQ